MASDCIQDVDKTTVSDESGSDSKCRGRPLSSDKKSRTKTDPTDFITDEMLEEERRLQGLRQEEMRVQKGEMLVDELSDQARSKRYEKLKCLLKKCTVYKEFLMNRIQKQAEEDKKMKDKLLKENFRILQEKQLKDQNTEKNSVTVELTRTSQPETSVKEHNDEEQKKDKGNEVPAVDNKEAGNIENECYERLVINGTSEPFLQPKLMEGGILRSYQVEGYNWLKERFEIGVNGILADEMGLGKTVQCVAILSHLVYMGISGPFLVCAPLSTVPNWVAEFKRFAPKVPIMLYHGPKLDRVQLLSKIKHNYKIRDGVSVQPVVITSFEIAMIDSKYLANYKWKYLILDEGHRIKNTHCRLVKALRMYTFTHRLLLTGTPLQNNLSELWSLLNFILPELFNDMGSFEQWFDVDYFNSTQAEEKIVEQEKAEHILGMLHQILTPFMLRRLKSDVDLEIPPKKEVLVFAPLTPLQKELYSALVDKTIFSKLKQKNNEEETVEMTASGRPKRKLTSGKVDYSLQVETDKERRLNKASRSRSLKRRWKDVEEDEEEIENWALSLVPMKISKTEEEKDQKTPQVNISMHNMLMEMRKCCNHPYLLEHPVDPNTGDFTLQEDIITASGKMIVLDKMLAELKRREHKVLIFSQMTRMLDLLEDFCKIRNYDFCRLDGNTSIDDRRENIGAFNSRRSGKFLFLLSTKAGGLGINLTGADTVIVYDSDWNPQGDIQAQDRCHRIGQKKPVVVYKFVTANTVDQKIVERAAAKRKLEKIVIPKGHFKLGLMTKVKPISPEELRDLLQSTDNESEIKNNTFTIGEMELNSLLDRSDLLQKWNSMKKAVKDKSRVVGQMPSVPVQSMPGSSSQEERKTVQMTQSQSKLFKVITSEMEAENLNPSNLETKINKSREVVQMPSVPVKSLPGSSSQEERKTVQMTQPQSNIFKVITSELETGNINPSNLETKINKSREVVQMPSAPVKSMPGSSSQEERKILQMTQSQSNIFEVIASELETENINPSNVETKINKSREVGQMPSVPVKSLSGSSSEEERKTVQIAQSQSNIFKVITSELETENLNPSNVEAKINKSREVGQMPNVPVKSLPGSSSQQERKTVQIAQSQSNIFKIITSELETKNLIPSNVETKINKSREVVQMPSVPVKSLPGSSSQEERKTGQIAQSQSNIFKVITSGLETENLNLSNVETKINKSREVVQMPSVPVKSLPGSSSQQERKTVQILTSELETENLNPSNVEAKINKSREVGQMPNVPVKSLPGSSSQEERKTVQIAQSQSNIFKILTSELETENLNPSNVEAKINKSREVVQMPNVPVKSIPSSSSQEERKILQMTQSQSNIFKIRTPVMETESRNLSNVETKISEMKPVVVIERPAAERKLERIVIPQDKSREVGQMPSAPVKSLPGSSSQEERKTLQMTQSQSNIFKIITSVMETENLNPSNVETKINKSREVGQMPSVPVKSIPGSSSQQERKTVQMTQCQCKLFKIITSVMETENLNPSNVETKISQTKPIVVYEIVTANTIDQKIIERAAERAAAKRKLEKVVIPKDKSREVGQMPSVPVKSIPGSSLQEERKTVQMTQSQSKLFKVITSVMETENINPSNVETKISHSKPVVVYQFVTANTVDQNIIERAAAKRKLEKIVIPQVCDDSLTKRPAFLGSVNFPCNTRNDKSREVVQMPSVPVQSMPGSSSLEERKTQLQSKLFKVITSVLEAENINPSNVEIKFS